MIFYCKKFAHFLRNIFKNLTDNFGTTVGYKKLIILNEAINWATDSLSRKNIFRRFFSLLWRKIWCTLTRILKLYHKLAFRIYWFMNLIFISSYMLSHGNIRNEKFSGRFDKKNFIPALSRTLGSFLNEFTFYFYQL